MDRRRFLLTSLAGALAAPLAADAQPAAKVVPRVGFLGLNPGANLHLRAAFLQGLRDLGYVEGRNVVIEYRSAEGKIERLPALAAELIALKVDVIVTGGGTPTALAAKQATRTLPIVFTSADRSGHGRARHQPCAPGRQCHGIVQPRPGAQSASVWSSSSRLFRESVRSRSCGSQMPPGNARTRTCCREQKSQRGRWGCGFNSSRRDGPADFDRAFLDMTRARAGALAVLGKRHLQQRAKTPRGPGGKAPAADGVPVEGFCRWRGPHGLWSEPG